MASALVKGRRKLSPRQAAFEAVGCWLGCVSSLQGYQCKKEGKKPKERRKDGQEWRRWAEMEGMGNAA